MMRFQPICFLPALLALFGGVKASAQLLYNNGATITVASGGALTVRGGFTNTASATVTNNGGTLNISGNTVNNGTMATNASGVLKLDGTTAQTLSGTSPVYAKAVVIDNSAGITVSTILNVDGAMTFTNGLLTATSAAVPVVFSANGSVANTPTNASHINGYVRKNGTGAFTYPVGDATSYQPVGVNLSSNASGMTARYYPGDAGSAPYGTTGTETAPLLFYNAYEYWDVSPATTATGTVTLYYDAYNNPGTTNPSDLRVAHKRGGEWLNEGGTANAGMITSNAISDWSPFTLGSISLSTPLPINLVDFEGIAQDAANLLTWRTAVEDAGTHFAIERSADGVAFQEIGRASGTGDGSSYNFYDRQPLSPLAYYRLRITTPGTAPGYSTTVLIQRGHTAGGGIALYPLPTGNTLTIGNVPDALIGSHAAVLDAQGRTVATLTLQATQQLDAQAWAAGIYTLKLADGCALKVIKQ